MISAIHTQVILLLFFSNTLLYAQQGFASLTSKDKRGIQERAWLLTKEYESLLSQISSTSMYPEEVKMIIENSYQGVNSRIFESEKVIIEEDLIPDQIHLDQPKDTTVKTYLKRFDLIYKDTNEQSVFFKNIEVSNVRSKDYIYVQVIFDSEFKSINKIKPKIAFQVYKRVVEIKAVKQDGKWNGYITYVGFHNPHTVRMANIEDKFVMENDKINSNQSNINELVENLPSIKFDYNRLGPTLMFYTKIINDDETSAEISAFKDDMKNKLLQILSTDDKNGALMVINQTFKELLPKYQESKENNQSLKQEKYRDELIFLFLWKSYVLYLKEQYNEAISVVNEGLVYDIDNTNLKFQKAILFSKLKGYGEANIALQHIFNKDNHFPKAYILMSKIYIAKGEKDKALSILKEYISRNGEFDKNILYELAEVYFYLGDRNNAEIYYKKSYVLDYNFLPPLFKASEIGIEDKKYKSVISYLENNEDRNRKLAKEPKYNYFLGKAFHYTDKDKDAVSFLKKAVELDINKLDAYLILAKIENKFKKSLYWINLGIKKGVITKKNLPLDLPEKITKKSQYTELIAEL